MLPVGQKSLFWPQNANLYSHARHVPLASGYRTGLRNERFNKRLSLDNSIYLCRAEPDEETLHASNKEYAALSSSIEKEASEAVESLQGTSIYLVGMMGTGKSTIGKMMSQALGYCFFDTDILIEQLAGKSVADIFDQDGESDFRTLETEVLQELAPFARCVVATGGGTPCRSQNWGHMQAGISVWLNGEPEMLAARVVKDSKNDRPLVAVDDAESKSDEEILAATVEKLRNLLEKRREQYGYADITVSLEQVGEQEASPAVIVQRILAAINDRIRRDSREREERKKFEIVDDQLPESMRVVENINDITSQKQQGGGPDPYLP